ncbi:MAG: zinc ribbon domain-containing protein, partial [Planctomycetaceae bacterium]
LIASMIHSFRASTEGDDAMSTDAGGLKRLHELHLRLEEVQRQLDRGPKQIAARERAIAQKQEELRARQEQLKSLKLTAQQKSSQHAGNEAKLAELRSKLNAAASNREYDIIRSHVEADSMANSVLEDEILEVLEKIDQLQQAIKQTEAACAAAREDAERVRTDVAIHEPDRRAQAEQLQSQLHAAQRTLPDQVVPAYRRLVQAHGASALAGVENRACTSCFAIVPSQQLIEINMGKIVFCRSCGRLLYKSDED